MAAAAVAESCEAVEEAVGVLRGVEVARLEEAVVVDLGLLEEEVGSAVAEAEVHLLGDGRVDDLVTSIMRAHDCRAASFQSHDFRRIY